MQRHEALDWIKRGQRRQDVLLRLWQPMTATQLCGVLDMDLDGCSQVLGDLARWALVECLNPSATRSLVFGATDRGHECRGHLSDHRGVPVVAQEHPDIDWELYGSVCFSHRSAIIRALERPMQPATIKRRALFLDPDVRMSANNVRDIIRLFRSQGIVRPLEVDGRFHPLYELTEVGRQFQGLLRGAQMRHPAR